jgi:hypothetical protein
MTPPLSLLVAVFAVIGIGTAALVVSTVYREPAADSRTRWSPQDLPAFDRLRNSATALTVIGIVFVGIPGALFLQVAAWLVSLFGFALLSGNKKAAWPIAILISALWPWPTLFVSRWCYSARPTYPLVVRHLLAGSACLGLGLAICFVFAFLHFVRGGH